MPAQAAPPDNGHSVKPGRAGPCYNASLCRSIRLRTPTVSTLRPPPRGWPPSRAAARPEGRGRDSGRGVLVFLLVHEPLSPYYDMAGAWGTALSTFWALCSAAAGSALRSCWGRWGSACWPSSSGRGWPGLRTGTVSTCGQGLGRGGGRALLRAGNHKILQTLFPPNSRLVPGLGEVGQHECASQPARELADGQRAHCEAAPCKLGSVRQGPHCMAPRAQQIPGVSEGSS